MEQNGIIRKCKLASGKVVAAPWPRETNIEPGKGQQVEGAALVCGMCTTPAQLRYVKQPSNQLKLMASTKGIGSRRRCS
jgi:hypothetical protein